MRLRRRFLQYPGYLAFSGAQLLLDWSALIAVMGPYLFQGRDLIGAQIEFTSGVLEQC